ncbi:MAG: hypothetical protein Kow0031_38080 [Anaerolineae bacterium]
MEKVIFAELYAAGVVYSTDPAQDFASGLRVNYCEQLEFETLPDGQIALAYRRGGTLGRLLYRGDYRVLVAEGAAPLP